MQKLQNDTMISLSLFLLDGPVLTLDSVCQLLRHSMCVHACMFAYHFPKSFKFETLSTFTLKYFCVRLFCHMASGCITAIP